MNYFISRVELLISLFIANSLQISHFIESN